MNPFDLPYGWADLGYPSWRMAGRCGYQDVYLTHGLGGHTPLSTDGVELWLRRCIGGRTVVVGLLLWMTRSMIVIMSIHREIISPSAMSMIVIMSIHRKIISPSATNVVPHSGMGVIMSLEHVLQSIE